METRARTCPDSSASFILNHHKFAFGISLMTEQKVRPFRMQARRNGTRSFPWPVLCTLYGGVGLFAPISTRFAQLLVGGYRIRCVCRADNGAQAQSILHFCIIFAVDYNFAGNRVAEKIKAVWHGSNDEVRWTK